MVIKNDNVVMVDIDSTLLAYFDYEANDKTDFVWIKINGKNEKFYVLRENVEAVLEHHRREHPIIFWSAGGYSWCYKATKALKLDKIGVVTMGKPKWLLDDKQPEEFLPRASLNKNYKARS